MPDAGGKGPRTTSVEARPSHLADYDSGDGDSGIRSAGEELEKNPAALDTGGAQRVRIAILRAWIGSKLNPYEKYRLISSKTKTAKTTSIWMPRRIHPRKIA